MNQYFVFFFGVFVGLCIKFILFPTYNGPSSKTTKRMIYKSKNGIYYRLVPKKIDCGKTQNKNSALKLKIT